MSAPATHLPVFRNEHLSVSRLRRFEQCALAFYFQYIDKQRAPEGLGGKPEAAEFGVVLHDALERVYRWIVEDEYEGAFPEAALTEGYREAWTASGLVGVALYQEGLGLLRAFARDAGPVDHMRILAIEKEFDLLVGPEVTRLVSPDEKEHWSGVPNHFVINGFIDRVDLSPDGGIDIIDYKSNRMLFSREELEDDLQMSVYSLACRELYPWAKSLNLSFHMLRHGMRQSCARTDAELAAARDYVISLGTRTERGPYEARLNANCGTCDHRHRCDAFKKAMDQKLEVVAVSASDLEALARERERVARIAKAAYARKENLDSILKSRLADVESLDLGGVVYRMLQYSDTVYPAKETIALLESSGVDPSPVLAIDNGALDALLDRLENDPETPKKIKDFLRLRVAAKAVKKPQKPRLDARVKKKA